jgi:hypothetical protein
LLSYTQQTKAPPLILELINLMVRLIGKFVDQLLEFKTKCLITKILEISSIVKLSVKNQITRFMNSMVSSSTQNNLEIQ